MATTQMSKFPESVKKIYRLEIVPPEVEDLPETSEQVLVRRQH